MNTYQHTQPGTAIVNCMRVMFVFFAVGSVFLHQFIIGTIIIAITGWVFRSMTIEISETELIWYFGSGFLRKRVPLSEVASAEPVTTTFWNGWGIHYTSRGWLYNVAGRGAVTITLRNGKQFCLGTDEPEELARQLMARK
ncbi:MAG TPA: hypothetical protein VH597_12660 [Verrucomicrobiae bacterium]|jgi:hypothetical protein|nr:hypothetical protein [Verrucomicrobiae bacterium]